MSKTPSVNKREQSPWLCMADVALRLGVSVSYVKTNVYSGQLKSVRFGKLRRIHKDDLDAFEAELRQQPIQRAVG